MIKTNKRKIILLIVLLFSLATIISSSYAADITINSADTFKDQIDDADSGSTIIINASKGEFKLNEENVDVYIDRTLTIQSSNPSQNAVIDLQKNGRAFYLDEWANLKLINLTFKNGFSDGRSGGAIYVEEGATITLTGCIFTNNRAEYHGGAIANYGIMTLTDCTFTNNIADNYGGALEIEEANATISNCIFTNNSAKYGGGAIDNWDAISTISNCIFTNNIAGYGGAILITGLNTTISTCTFNNNTAIGYEDEIYDDLLEDSVLTNISGTGGAIDFKYVGADVTITVTSCDFINNNASLGNIIFADESFKGNINVTYSRFISNLNGYYIYNNGTGSLIADYNWWGSNSPLGKFTNVYVNNYYMMNVTTAVANLTNSYDENLAVDYSFFLNGTKDNANAATKFKSFTVCIIANGKLWQNIDGRKSAQFMVPLTAIDNIITVQLNSESLTVKYKASKMSTSLVVNNLKPLFNKANTIKITVTDKNGKLLANKKVNLLVNGKVVATTTTNGAGIAIFSYKFKTRKAHKISAEIANDATHATGNTKALTLTPKDKTKITLAKLKAQFKKIATFKATLKNNKNKAIAKKYIKFYANKKYLGQAKTNAKGIAILTKKVPVKGVVSFIAKYKGDKNNHDSDYTRKLKVK